MVDKKTRQVAGGKTSGSKSGIKSGKKRMTKAEMRVAIARDVIAKVKSHKLHASPGTYVKPSECSLGDIPDEASAQEVIRNVPSCRVCALGAACVAALDRFNSASVLDIFGPADAFYGDRKLSVETPTGNTTTRIHIYLRRFFSEKQLGIMESYFEGCDKDNGRGIPNGEKYGSEGAYQFKQEYYDPQDRLLRIMRNLIRNGGEFVPPKRFADLRGAS